MGRNLFVAINMSSNTIKKQSTYLDKTYIICYNNNNNNVY